MHNCRGIHKKKKGAKKKKDYDDEISSHPAGEENQRNPPESVASLRSRSPEWVFTITGIRTIRPRGVVLRVCVANFLSVESMKRGILVGIQRGAARVQFEIPKRLLDLLERRRRGLFQVLQLFFRSGRESEPVRQSSFACFANEPRSWRSPAAASTIPCWTDARALRFLKSHASEAGTETRG